MELKFIESSPTLEYVQRHFSKWTNRY